MNAKPSDGAMFMVVTPEQARLWEKTGEEKSCGCSSEDKYVGADRSWSGKFNIPGTYYIVVKHSGIHATPTDYALSVSGNGVSISQAAAPAAPVAAAPVKTAGAGVTAEEMSPFEDWMAMEGGTSHWETFHLRQEQLPGGARSGCRAQQCRHLQRMDAGTGASLQPGRGCRADWPRHEERESSW